MATASEKRNGRNGSQSRTPIWSKRFWPVEVSVFEFVHDGRPTHSVKITKSFRRDEESEWESSDYLSGNDLLAAAELLRDAYQFVQARVQKAFAAKRDDSAAIGNPEAAAEAIPF